MSRLALDAGTRARLQNFSSPVLSPAREMERFKQLVQDIGLVDYRREWGWSDYCRPLGDNDFVCE